MIPNTKQSNPEEGSPMRSTRTAPTIALAAAFSLALAACGSDAGDTSDSDASDTAEIEADDAIDAEVGDTAVDLAPEDGDEAAAVEPAEESAGDEQLPTIAVTINVLGDVVGAVVGKYAEVVTIMPVGADPHGFAASADQVNRMLTADADGENRRVLDAS